MHIGLKLGYLLLELVNALVVTLLVFKIMLVVVNGPSKDLSESMCYADRNVVPSQRIHVLEFVLLHEDFFYSCHLKLVRKLHR